MRRVGLAVVVLLLLAGCGDGDELLPGDTLATTSDSEQQSGEESSESATSDSNEVLPVEPVPTTTGLEEPEERSDDDSKLPEPVPPPEGEPVTGEAGSDIVTAIMADLVERSGVVEADIMVVRSESVIWNDGSLGCPLPGESYTQALVNGYWVVLEAEGKTYDYRATDRGYFRLCEGGGAPPSNPTG